MKKAAELLLTTDLNIAEIGFKLVLMILSILADVLRNHLENLHYSIEKNL